MNIPDYKDRNPEQIIKENTRFDSADYSYRAVSWLDFAKREKSISALQYAALEIRHSIEQLFFEELVMSVGTELDRSEYEKCKGNSTKLHKIIKKLNPDYEKFTDFTVAIMSVNKSFLHY